MIESLGHDPLCPATYALGDPEWAPCQCDLIARAHADERDRLRSKVKALPETRYYDPWDWHEVVEVALDLLDEEEQP